MNEFAIAHRKINPMRLEPLFHEISIRCPSVRKKFLHHGLYLLASPFPYSGNRPHRCNKLEEVTPLLGTGINYRKNTIAQTYYGIPLSVAQTCKSIVQDHYLEGGLNKPLHTSYSQEIIDRPVSNPEIIRLQITMIEMDPFFQIAEKKTNLCQNLQPQRIRICRLRHSLYGTHTMYELHSESRFTCILENIIDMWDSPIDAGQTQRITCIELENCFCSKRIARIDWGFYTQFRTNRRCAPNFRYMCIATLIFLFPIFQNTPPFLIHEDSSINILLRKSFYRDMYTFRKVDCLRNLKWF